MDSETAKRAYGLAAVCSAAVLCASWVSCSTGVPHPQQGNEVGASPDPSGGIAGFRLNATGGSAQYDAVGRPLGRAAGTAARLAPVEGYNQFWFAWSVFHDGSAVFNRDKPVRTAPIAGSGMCAVPCDEILAGCPGRDCIPALTKPPHEDASGSGHGYLADSSLVVGVDIGGEARAYPHPILWWHEVVNDVVGGSNVAVTHCPLTFSSIGHDRDRFVIGRSVELGVSGLLYNSNLVFYDRADESYFSQLLGVGTEGPALGKPAPRVPVFEMTWGAWRALYPNTTVLSSSTGYARDYTSYPYGGYATDNGDTFGTTHPAPDPMYPNKAVTYGVTINGQSKAYVHNELAAWASSHRGVVNDSVGGQRIAVVFDLDAQYVQAFVLPDGVELAVAP